MSVRKRVVVVLAVADGQFRVKAPPRDLEELDEIGKGSAGVEGKDGVVLRVSEDTDDHALVASDGGTFHHGDGLEEFHETQLLPLFFDRRRHGPHHVLGDLLADLSVVTKDGGEGANDTQPCAHVLHQERDAGPPSDRLKHLLVVDVLLVHGVVFHEGLEEAATGALDFLQRLQVLVVVLVRG